MDVKIALLNENLEKYIYMVQPIGFVSKRQEHKVCLLKRSIYGLKNPFRAWYFSFHEAVISFSLNMVSEDHYVYVKNYKRDDVSYFVC